jgi:DNA-binding PadR family transcriptional regulator
MGCQEGGGRRRQTRQQYALTAKGREELVRHLADFNGRQKQESRREKTASHGQVKRDNH